MAGYAENDLVGLESLVDLPSPGTSTSTGTATALLSEERLAPKNYSAFDDLLVFTKARGHSFTPPQTPPVAKKVVVNDDSLDKKEKAIKAGKSKAQEVIANLQDKIKQLELEKAHEIEKLKQVVQDKDEQIRQLNNEQARDEEEDKDDALMMLKLSELRKNEQIEALTLERDRLEEEAHREMVNSMSNLQEIQAQLEVEKAKNALLTSQNQDFHKKRDSDKKITQLESDLDKKTAEASRLRNDLHHLKKQYERTASVNEKLADQHQHYLRNAAHLVAPSMHTKLPKNIYSCIACWMNNLQCDNLASCKNCTDDPNAQKCRRWRCSIMQIMKSCPGPPLCNLQHNEEGWLRLHVPRPEW